VFVFLSIAEETRVLEVKPPSKRKRKSKRAHQAANYNEVNSSDDEKSTSGDKSDIDFKFFNE